MRLFIALPTLLSEFILFHSSGQTGISPSSSSLFPLRTINSLIFVVWWLGWLSSLKTTLYFLLNKINTILLGNEPQPTFRDSLVRTITALISIAAYQINYKRFEEVSLQPMIVGSSLSSILTFIGYNCFLKKLSATLTLARPFILITIEILTLVLLVVLNASAKLEDLKLSLFLGIDLGIYVLLNVFK